MPRASALTILTVVASSLIGCDNSNTSLDEIDAVTVVAVNPVDFPADAQCSRDAQSGTYVAELIDVSGRVDLDEDSKNVRDFDARCSSDKSCTVDDFVVQRATDIPCGKVVGFSKAVPNREYKIRISVYGDNACPRDRAGATVHLLRDESGACPETGVLATPKTQFDCYGWTDDTSSGGASSGGASSTSSGGTSATPKFVGRPVRAIDRRLVFAEYCPKP